MTLVHFLHLLKSNEICYLNFMYIRFDVTGDSPRITLIIPLLMVDTIDKF